MMSWKCMAEPEAGKANAEAGRANPELPSSQKTGRWIAEARTAKL